MTTKTPINENEAKYYTAIHLLATCDEGIQSWRLRQAIKDIQNLIDARENIPF